jgi:hypothetical protein
MRTIALACSRTWGLGDTHNFGHEGVGVLPLLGVRRPMHKTARGGPALACSRFWGSEKIVRASARSLCLALSGIRQRRPDQEPRIRSAACHAHGAWRQHAEDVEVRGRAVSDHNQTACNQRPISRTPHTGSCNRRADRLSHPAAAVRHGSTAATPVSPRRETLDQERGTSKAACEARHPLAPQGGIQRTRLSPGEAPGFRR